MSQVISKANRLKIKKGFDVSTLEAFFVRKIVKYIFRDERFEN